MIYTKEMIKEKNEQIARRRKIRFWILLPILVVIFSGIGYIAFQKIVKHNNNVGFAGLRQYVIMTGSMSPQLEVGDLILVKKVDYSKIQVGDIITYSYDNENTVTHRVSDVVYRDGEIYYETRGDSNNVGDGLVPYSMVQGKVICRIKQMGNYISSFMTGIGGIIIFVIVIVSYTKTVREEERMIAREEARKKHNVCKYKKETSTNDNL